MDVSKLIDFKSVCYLVPQESLKRFLENSCRIPSMFFMPFLAISLQQQLTSAELVDEGKWTA